MVPYLGIFDARFGAGGNIFLESRDTSHLLSTVFHQDELLRPIGDQLYPRLRLIKGWSGTATNQEGRKKKR